MLEGWALCEHRVEFHTDRSSPSQVFYKINVLKEFAKFTGKHLCCSLVLIVILQHRCFFCEFCKMFKNTFFTGHLLVTAFVLNAAICI